MKLTHSFKIYFFPNLGGDTSISHQICLTNPLSVLESVPSLSGMTLRIDKWITVVNALSRKTPLSSAQIDSLINTWQPSSLPVKACRL